MMDEYGGPPPAKRGRGRAQQPEASFDVGEAEYSPNRADEAVGLLPYHDELTHSPRNHHGHLAARNQLTSQKFKAVIALLQHKKLQPELALRVSGISKQLMGTYAKLADDDSAHPIYRYFVEDFAKIAGEVVAELRAKGEALANASQDSRWYMWELERYAPEMRPKMQVEIDIQVRVQVEVLLDALERALPPESYQVVLEVASTLGGGKGPSRG